MTIENKTDLQAKINHYIKAGEYDIAKRFATQYSNIQGFDVDKALQKIKEAQEKPGNNKTRR
jgi:hypothetical protein